MSRKIDLTIAVLTTKDRPQLLASCLKSIHSQKIQPNKILVIQDQPKAQTIPQKRNLALNKCQTRFLAFVDDDCRLDDDWIKSAYSSINQHKVAFVVGRTLPATPLNWVSQLQFGDYQQWFYNQTENQQNKYAVNEILDTKNIIIDILKIDSVRFDTNFKIFEDIDFGLQLKKQGFTGIYCDKMIVFHHENSTLLKLIHKSYRRGQFKKILNAKWGNFDNYTPVLMSSSPLKLFFTLGYIFQKAPLITIVNSLDKGANGQRAQNFYNFIKSRYYNVELYDSSLNFRKNAFNWDNSLLYGPSFFLYHFFQVLKYIFHIDLAKYHFYYYLLLRGSIVSFYLKHRGTTIAIIQYPEDISCIRHSRNYQILYDSPTIFEDELSKDTRYSPAISQLEKNIYQQADWISFHWYTYFKILHLKHIYPKKEVMLNWGCRPSQSQAIFSKKLKIIYLGILNSPWVNPELLKSLSKQYDIDIYSYETPDPVLYPKGSLNYCGYLQNLDDMSQYQLGLISISTDTLRTHGFSAKYLDYMNYGLPVLCPKWRRDELLKPATIYYNEKNFIKIIQKYQNQKLWQAKHQATQKLCRQLVWENNLHPLLQIIDSKNYS